MTAFKQLILTTSLFALSACATNPLSQARTDVSFSDRALEINEAYYKELNGQILKNILRARDRQPRLYTSLSELQITPNATRTDTLGVGDLGLGNPGGSNLNPWVVLSGSTVMANQNHLQLKISPKGTNGDDKTPIYHQPISPQTFLSYYGDWNNAVIDNIMVNQIRKVVASDYRVTDFYTKEVSYPNEDLISNIEEDINTGDGVFHVFLDKHEAFYCFDDKDCKIRKKVVATSKPSSLQQVKVDVNVNDNTKSTSPTKSKIEDYELKQGAVYTKIDFSAPDLNRNKKQTINLKSGYLFGCESAVVKANRTNTLGVKKDVQMNKFTCEPVSRGTIGSNASLIYVVTSSQNNIPMESGIYSISLNSIDDMIYRVGASLEKAGKPDWVSSINDAQGNHFFAIKKLDRTGGNEKTCRSKYAAQVNYHGEIYLSGPPEAHESNGTMSGAGKVLEPCYEKDNSGTVLTLISEIIKLNEVNAELTNSNFILAN